MPEIASWPHWAGARVVRGFAKKEPFRGKGSDSLAVGTVCCELVSGDIPCIREINRELGWISRRVLVCDIHFHK